MKEKAPVEKARLIEGHVEALVRDAISCGNSREQIIELVYEYWEKEQNRFLDSHKLLEREISEAKKKILVPVDTFIRRAIKEKVSKSNAKKMISKLWNKAIEMSDCIHNDLAQFSTFEVYCIQLIMSAFNNGIYNKSHLLTIIDTSWDKIYRTVMLPAESSKEKKFKGKVREYAQNKSTGLFWFINSLDYSSAANPMFATDRVGCYKMHNWIKQNDLTKSEPKGMYWLILEEKYEPIISIDTSVAEEILGAINYLYPIGTAENASPDKIVNQAMKRMTKIYDRWNGNIGEDIRRLIKLIRLYVHEVEPSKQCKEAVEELVHPDSTYLDKAIARVLWEVENNN